MTDLSLTLDDLGPMFEDPAAGLSDVQRLWWARWDSGAEIDSGAYQQVPAYRVAADTWSAVNGKAASKSREKFLALKRAEQDFYRACAAEHTGRYRASQSTVDAAVLLVIDAEGGVLPRAALLDAGVPADEVARISGKTGARRKVKKALQKHAEHQNAKRMIQTEGKREYMRMANDTLSGSLEGIAVNMKTQARLARLEQSEADHARRIAELEARLAAVEVRHAVEDAGIDPRAEAQRLHAGGLGYKAIAARIGRSQSTVRNWIKAA
ncbi:helix-turn-helix domain-containing protein [Pseudomonas putida]|uniref:helix-turn-helix domain-containing protein n=1 Tax=Pseudomonas TaxID=286 RepID=UPI000FB339C0|nr:MULTISPECIES: helix-turn-helix domain-containing protein [Pseudomonas]MCG3644552.1 helix-turn-helix domain-containing protein [Pseudomonas putida]TFW21401.1 helix-turn-helix domain-containing protein [Pseudomonas putida]WPU58725.1 helix-turn-helix domain-containing protein [Pseudomonas asiatica]